MSTYYDAPTDDVGGDEIPVVRGVEGLPRCTYSYRETLPCPWCHDGCAYFSVQTTPAPLCGTEAHVPCAACTGDCVYAQRRTMIQQARRDGVWWDGHPWEDVYWEDPDAPQPEAYQESTLNPEQEQAATHVDGPALVIAGAGSGKTRTLIHRICYLMQRRNVDPRQILAVTFTRKAASEMRSRVAGEVGDETAKRLTISTFHALALDVCRDEPSLVNRSNGFSIWDDGTMRSEMRRILREAWEESRQKGKRPQAREVLELLGKRKSTGHRELFGADFVQHVSKLHSEIVVAALREYEEIKRLSNAMDYDDLIWSVVVALETHDSLRQHYQDRWHYVMVDEYQDTNDLQERLIGLLVGGRCNLMAVGDEDQAIYSFRGANSAHIMGFERRYPGARVIELGKNYRSTNNILSAAARVIENNDERRPKNLRTDNQAGWEVEYLKLRSAPDEARYLARQILGSIKAGYAPETHAVLVRTRRQFIPLQMALSEWSIPYVTVGALDFWQRVDVKLVMAWLKSWMNPRDLSAGALVFSHWPRVGAKTVAEWKRAASSAGNMWDVLGFVSGRCGPHTKRGESVQRFRDAVRELDARIRRGDSIQELVLWFYEVTGLDDEIEKGLEGSGKQAEEARGRVDLKDQFVAMCPDERGSEPYRMIEAFLDSVVTQKGSDAQVPRVVLSTIHGSKGLEWDHVWVVGMVEGLLPHSTWVGDQLMDLSASEIEEERRLAYVAMTRARNRLVMTHYPLLIANGVPRMVRPSRFLVESVLHPDPQPEPEINLSPETPSSTSDQVGMLYF